MTYVFGLENGVQTRLVLAGHGLVREAQRALLGVHAEVDLVRARDDVLLKEALVSVRLLDRKVLGDVLPAILRVYVAGLDHVARERRHQQRLRPLLRACAASEPPRQRGASERASERAGKSTYRRLGLLPREHRKVDERHGAEQVLTGGAALHDAAQHGRRGLRGLARNLRQPIHQAARALGQHRLRRVSIDGPVRGLTRSDAAQAQAQRNAARARTGW